MLSFPLFILIHVFMCLYLPEVCSKSKNQVALMWFYIFQSNSGAKPWGILSGMQE